MMARMVEAEEVFTRKFPCPSCGGGMEFSPNTQKLKCPYCKTEVDIDNENANVKEYDLDDYEELLDHSWGGEKIVMKCRSCGGQTIVDSEYISHFCSFCDSSNIVRTDDKVGIRPENLITFHVDEKAAKEKFKKWIKSRYYAPNTVRSASRLDKITGIYIPYFTYDSDSTTAYSGQRGDHYYTTRTRIVNGQRQTERVRKTRWRRADGVVSGHHDDIPVSASANVDESLVRGVGRYDFDNLVPYRPEYLSGYITEKYTMNLRDGWSKAKDYVDSEILGLIQRDAGGDVFRLSSKRTDYGKIRFKHVLLPMYITSYKYRGEIYQILINGYNGRISGDYPKSIVKIILTGLALFLIFVIVMFLLETY